MPSVNKVTLIGNVGKDPEMRFTPNGKANTSFSVATNRRYTTSDGEKKEETEWFTVQAWGKLAELCNQYVKKGDIVYVEGGIHLHHWTAQDGAERYRNEIRAEKVEWGFNKNGSGTGETEEDDIPF
jgi:single-strand DNA-binding protein